jgi:hypothetical protein
MNQIWAEEAAMMSALEKVVRSIDCSVYSFYILSSGLTFDILSICNPCRILFPSFFALLFSYQVLTYDLRKERRTVGHLTREGQFTSLSQRTDSEQELVTCDAQVYVTSELN